MLVDSVTHFDEMFDQQGHISARTLLRTSPLSFKKVSSVPMQVPRVSTGRDMDSIMVRALVEIAWAFFLTARLSEFQKLPMPFIRGYG